MDQARVVEVWAPDGGRAGTGRVGTGYLLAERLVLTSFHVLAHVPPGGRVEVRPLQVPQRTGWLAATWCWPRRPVDLDAAPDHDAALLVIEGPHGVGGLEGAVRFGRITGQDTVPCVGLGFPDAEARPDGRRDTMPVRGHVDALHARRSGMLTVHVDTGVVPRARAGGSGWAGSSGTALFCGPSLVGVLATDRPIARDASVLGAVALSALAGLPGFRDTLAEHGIDLRLEHASPTARLLTEFLTAAHRAAVEHPYAGVLPGTAPPLAAVYLRQRVRRRDHDAAAHGAVSGATPADAVLADPPTCVVVAGPGGGKSSLLRTRMAEGAARFLDGEGGPVLPVLVPAAALTAELPLRRALSEAVTAALAHHGLNDVVPPELFATAPQPGVRWLVLVDGLDEVSDPAARHRVLTRVARVGDGDDRDLYRFVIATRPLPDGTLDPLGPDVPRYDLQPFGDDDLPRVADGWFRAVGLPDPGDAAERFAVELDHSRLAAVARVPLMAAMLCQLHATAPDQPLAGGRGEIYDRFTTLLHRHQHAFDASARSARLLAGVDRYGPAASARAEATLNHLPALTGHLAAARQQSGDTRPAVDIVQSHPSARRPERVPADDWNAFLDAALRGSGQLTAHSGDLVFLHQTLQEHLAARHVMDDPRTGAQVLRRVFDQSDRYGPSGRDLGIAPRVWGTRYWETPREDPSYVGFLLDAAHLSGVTAGPRYLNRLARSGVRGCDFISELAQLGTALPDHLLRSTADRLHRLARNRSLDGDDRVDAATSLMDVGDARAADLLNALATDPDLDDIDHMNAADALAELDDHRAADLLHALAQDTGVESDARVGAAISLAYLDDPRAADPLYTLVNDPTLSWDSERLNAAAALVHLQDPRAADALYVLAQNPALSGRDRLDVACELAERGDARAADPLYALANDATLDIRDRLDAAKPLVALLTDAMTDAPTLAEPRLLALSARVDAVHALIERLGTDLSDNPVLDTGYQPRPGRST
ncbi:NACHT domain-containing protein [Streptomyces sp. NPDC091279]|uniref:NACHT domain-containing protein n=1 Tax=Streptomyces sp. NPDC091279 TaxID=3365983 RepID=UPI00381953DE